MKTLFVTVFFLNLFLYQGNSQIATWNHNTYPGPGHKLNPGPWTEGQGYARTEKSYGFGMHPNNPDFMIYLTDIGGIALSIDGIEFKNIDVIDAHSAVGVGFDPFDNGTAYVNINSEVPGGSGWWRTKDGGSTWSLMLERPYGDIMLAGNSRTKWYLEHGRLSGQEDHIYVATKDGLMRSVDNGETWETVGFDGQEILMIRMSKDGSRLYVIPRSPAREYGPLWRIDNGDVTTLQEVNTANVSSIDIHPVHPDSGWLVTNVTRLCSFSGGGSHISDPVLINNNQINNVQINPHNGNHIIASGSGRFTEGSFYVSTDGGQSFKFPLTEFENGYYTWIKDYSPTNLKGSSNNYYIDDELSGTPGARIMGFVNDSTIKSYMMLGWIRGPYQSTDYGLHFKPFGYGGNSKPPSTGCLQVFNEDTMAMGKTESGIWLTADGGKSWAEYNCYNDNDIRCNGYGWQNRSGWGLAFHPTDPNTIVATFSADPWDIYKSTDFGKTWKRVASRAGLPNAREVFWHKQNPAIVFAGDLKSTDAGETFSNIEYPVADICPRNGDLVIGYTWEGNGPIQYKLSSDAGETWTTVPYAPQAKYFGRDICPRGDKSSGVVIDPDPIHDPTKGGNWRILVGSRDGSGIYEYNATNNNGSEGKWTLNDMGINQEATWKPEDALTKRLNYMPIALDEVVFDPRQGYSNIVYAAASGQWLSGTGGYRQIYRSLDAGKTWHKITGEGFKGMRDYIHASAVAVSPVSGKYFLASNEGLFSLDVSGYDPTADVIKPTAPDGLTVNSSEENHVLLSWNPSTDNVKVEGYIIYRDSSRVGATKHTTYRDGYFLAQGNSYNYYVVAYDAANNISDTSNHVLAETQSSMTQYALHWTFDETGQEVLDASGNGNDGFLINMNDTNRRDNGVYGNCIKFDNPDQYIEASNPTAGNSESLTISFWMKMDSYTDAVLFDKMPDEGKSGWKIRVYKEGTIRMEVGNEVFSNGIEGSHAFYELNKWYHLSCRYAGKKSYIELIKNSTYWAENGSFLYSPYNTTDSITTLRISGNRGIQLDDIKISYSTGERKNYFDIYNDRGKLISISDSTNGTPLASGTFIFPEDISLLKTTSNLSIANGFTDTIYAFVSPENPFNKNIQWELGDTTNVQVLESNNEMAIIYGKSTGITTITAYTEEGSLSVACDVNVIRPLYQINISASNGKVSLTPEHGPYDEGTEVVLEAIPNTGYSFNKWTGDITDSLNPISITMNENKSIIANFDLIEGITGNLDDIPCIIYPNPIESGVLTIELGTIPTESFKIMIYDTRGSLLLMEEQNHWKNKFKIDIGHLNAGIYLVKLKSISFLINKRLMVN